MTYGPAKQSRRIDKQIFELLFNVDKSLKKEKDNDIVRRERKRTRIHLFSHFTDCFLFTFTGPELANASKLRVKLRVCSKKMKFSKYKYKVNRRLWPLVFCICRLMPKLCVVYSIQYNIIMIYNNYSIQYNIIMIYNNILYYNII